MLPVMINSNFYNPKPEVSFLTLRTNTQIFAPHEGLHKLPVIAKDPHTSGVFTAPSPVETSQEAIDKMIEDQLQLRMGTKMTQPQDPNYPRQSGGLLPTHPPVKHGDTAPLSMV